MAVERDDLDELNRPPRRIHAVNTSSNGTSNKSGEDGAGRMGEPTVAEMLLVEMRDIKRILAEAMTEQAKMRVQVDAHESDLRDLKLWREAMPDKAQQREVQRFQMTWQNVGGIMGILTFLAYIVAPHIHLQ